MSQGISQRPLRVFSAISVVRAFTAEVAEKVREMPSKPKPRLPNELTSLIRMACDLTRRQSSLMTE